MGEKILWLIKTFALLFNRLLSAWLVTDANCSSTQLTVKLYPLWFSYILWLGVDSSRRRCRVSNTPHFSSFYRLCFMCCVQGLLTHTAVTCPGKWLVTHLCSHYFIQSPHWCLCAWKGINSRNPILWESVFFFFYWLYLYFIDCYEIHLTKVLFRFMGF